MKSQLEQHSLDRLLYVGTDEDVFAALARVTDDLEGEVFDLEDAETADGFAGLSGSLRGTLLCVDGSGGRSLAPLRERLATLTDRTVLLLFVSDETEQLDPGVRRRADAIYPRDALDSPALVETVRHAHERRSLKRDLALSRNAIDSVRHALVVTDARRDDNPLVFCNTTFYDITGYTPNDVLGRNCRFLQCDDTDEDETRAIRRAVDAGEPITRTILNQRSDGTEFWNRLSITPLENADGRVTHFLGIQEDVSRRVERERRLDAQRSELRAYEKIVENATDAVSVTDEEGRYVLVNESFTELTGQSRDELLGSRSRDVLRRDFGRRAVTDRFHSQPAGSGKVIEETLTIDGEERIYSTVVVPLQYGEGHRTVCIRREITERRRMEERLEYRARHDDLTGLANRPTFRRRLERALRTATSGAVAFIDLDDFKRINDSHGHAAGDRVLVQLAERLRGCIRSNDVAARIGGDEFVVLLCDLPGEDAADRVRERLETIFDAPVEVQGTSITVDGAIGITDLPGEPPEETDLSSEAEAILRAADRAMYRKKGVRSADEDSEDVELDDAVEQEEIPGVD